MKKITTNKIITTLLLTLTLTSTASASTLNLYKTNLKLAPVNTYKVKRVLPKIKTTQMTTKSFFGDVLGAVGDGVSAVVNTTGDAVGAVVHGTGEVVGGIVHGTGDAIGTVIGDKDTGNKIVDPLGIFDDPQRAVDPLGVFDDPRKVTDPLGIFDDRKRKEGIAERVVDPLGLLNKPDRLIDPLGLLHKDKKNSNNSNNNKEKEKLIVDLNVLRHKRTIPSSVLQKASLNKNVIGIDLRQPGSSNDKKNPGNNGKLVIPEGVLGNNNSNNNNNNKENKGLPDSTRERLLIPQSVLDKLRRHDLPTIEMPMPDLSNARPTPLPNQEPPARLVGEESKCGTPYPKDIDGHWGEIFVRRMYDLCITEGYADGLFRPNQSITRAELVKMALVARGISPNNGCYDNDCGSPFVDLDQWQGKWIRPAWDLGIIQGYGNRFYPNRAITRAEAVKVVLKTFGYKPLPVQKSFFNDVNGWATGWIEAAHLIGLVQGIGNGNFDPDRAITRAEAAKVVVKMLEYWDTQIN